MNDKPTVKPSFFIQNCFGAGKLTRVFVATYQASVIGFISSHDWLSLGGGGKVRSINLLYVLDEWRGQGVATTLIRHTIADAKEHGCKRVDNEADVKNREANRLYPHLGFVEKKRNSIRYQMPLK